MVLSSLSWCMTIVDIKSVNPKSMEMESTVVLGKMKTREQGKNRGFLYIKFNNKKNTLSSQTPSK